MPYAAGRSTNAAPVIHPSQIHCVMLRSWLVHDVTGLRPAFSGMSLASMDGERESIRWKIVDVAKEEDWRLSLGVGRVFDRALGILLLYFSSI